MHRLPLFLVASLTGCAVSEIAKSPNQQSWSNACYLWLEQDVQTIASDSPRNCGFSPISAAQRDKDATISCVKEAIKQGVPFKAGYEAFGDDSRYCTVLVTDSDGTIWNLFFDDDVTGQFGRNGDHSVIWVRQCKTVTLAEGWFDVESCEDDSEMLAKIAANRSKSE